jgi:hypothetical protein
MMAQALNNSLAKEPMVAPEYMEDPVQSFEQHQLKKEKCRNNEMVKEALKEARKMCGRRKGQTIQPQQTAQWQITKRAIQKHGKPHSASETRKAWSSPRWSTLSHFGK